MSGLAPEIFADHSLSSQRAFARGVSTVPKQHRLKDDVIMLTPVDMSLHNKSRRFDIAYEDGSSYSFTFEFLRVFSPSADVQGHTPDEAKLQVGKRDVTIVAGSTSLSSASSRKASGKPISKTSSATAQAATPTIRPMRALPTSPRQPAPRTSTKSRAGCVPIPVAAAAAPTDNHQSPL